MAINSAKIYHLSGSKDIVHKQTGLDVIKKGLERLIPFTFEEFYQRLQKSDFDQIWKSSDPGMVRFFLRLWISETLDRILEEAKTYDSYDKFEIFQSLIQFSDILANTSDFDIRSKLGQASNILENSQLKNYNKSLYDFLITFSAMMTNFTTSQNQASRINRDLKTKNSKLLGLTLTLMQKATFYKLPTYVEILLRNTSFNLNEMSPVLLKTDKWDKCEICDKVEEVFCPFCSTPLLIAAQGRQFKIVEMFVERKVRK